jgi:hypothetical protein
MMKSSKKTTATKYYRTNIELKEHQFNIDFYFGQISNEVQNKSN